MRICGHETSLRFCTILYMYIDIALQYRFMSSVSSIYPDAPRVWVGWYPRTWVISTSLTLFVYCVYNLWFCVRCLRSNAL